MTEEQKKICRANPYEKLYEKLEEGSYEALVTFIRCSDFHDGGNIEDLHVQSGLFLLKNPFLYTYILEKEGVTGSCLEPFFVMLHPDLVDNFEGKRAEVRERIKALETLQSSKVRDYGIQALRESLKDMQAE